MPVIQGVCGSYFTYTAQNVINSVASDLRQQIGPEHPNLLDYVNRISLTLLRVSRWKFLLSGPQQFITQPEQTDYWIGASGGAPYNAVDTGLDLTDLDIIKEGSVFDRSNYKVLNRTAQAPIVLSQSFQDGSSRAGRPKLWRHDQATGCVMNIYPAPDNNNTYQPAPGSPIFNTLTPGGSLPARFYWLWATYVDTNNGEGFISMAPSRAFIPAGYLITVNPPIEITLTTSSGVQFNRWNLYATPGIAGVTTAPTNTGNLQNVSPLNNNQTFTEPTSGLVSNTKAGPTSSTLEPLNGYVIQFEYFFKRVQLTSTNMNLQIPDQYFDIVVAGVNWLAAKYLSIADQAAEWQAIFKDGITQMIHDKNLFPKGGDYVSVDGATVASYTPSIETFMTNWPASI